MNIQQQMEDQLRKNFSQWQYVYRYGGHDPFWSDGVNLDLIRNHILYYKKRIEEECKDGRYPDVYYQNTPPEVDEDYMAQPDVIRENAKQALAEFQKDKNYKFILQSILTAGEEIKKESCIITVIGYVIQLRKAIQGNNLISMRRCSGAHYEKAFKDCADRIKNAMANEHAYKRAEDGQLSLF